MKLQQRGSRVTGLLVVTEAQKLRVEVRIAGAVLTQRAERQRKVLISRLQRLGVGLLRDVIDEGQGFLRQNFGGFHILLLNTLLPYRLQMCL